MSIPLPRGDEHAVAIHRAADRAATRLAWLTSRQSFSFGPHYDPANTHHGALLANNDDVVAAGAGFDAHPHVDMEIVTWVLRGSLVHQDSQGHSGVVYPGLAQRMSAGRGIAHSERNAAAAPASGVAGAVPREPDAPPTASDPGAVHVVQMWVRPDDTGSQPSYERSEIDEASLTGGLVAVASGEHRRQSAISIGARGATLYAARLQPGQAVGVPEAAFVHLFVPAGAVELEEVGALAAGDAVRFTASGGHRVTATEPTELLIWEMQRDR